MLIKKETHKLFCTQHVCGAITFLLQILYRRPHSKLVFPTCLTLNYLCIDFSFGDDVRSQLARLISKILEHLESLINVKMVQYGPLGHFCHLQEWQYKVNLYLWCWWYLTWIESTSISYNYYLWGEIEKESSFTFGHIWKSFNIFARPICTYTSQETIHKVGRHMTKIGPPLTLFYIRTSSLSLESPTSEHLI